MLFNFFKKYSDRPIIKIEPTAFGKILDAIAFVLLLLLLVYVFQNYPNLPERIPKHFGSGGRVDEFGKKQSILFLPIIATVIFVLIMILKRFPHKFNYMVKITPKNAEQQYKIGVKIIQISNVFAMAVLWYTSFKIINIALHKDKPDLGDWFAPLVSGIAIIGTLSVIIISVLKNKK
jgi:uncharacterized membrane protein